MLDRYKMGLMYLKMLENPKKFKFVERFMATKSNQTRMGLRFESEIQEFKQLQA